MDIAIGTGETPVDLAAVVFTWRRGSMLKFVVFQTEFPSCNRRQYFKGMLE